MTDGGAGGRPARGEASIPVRPRSAFVAHEVFGRGAGAVLVAPEVARDLRTAAEFASQERRIAGGLLYGLPWADDEGQYLVVDGFLEAGPGENHDDKIASDGRDSFALSAADLRLLRQDAARMYSSGLEVGWWRSLPGPGAFGPRDFESQRQFVGPGGAGLLVFGSGLEWGTAYLGPDGDVPGSARSFIPVPRPAPEPPGLGPDPMPAVTPEPLPAPEARAGGNALEESLPENRRPDADAALEGNAAPQRDAGPERDAALEGDAALEPEDDLDLEPEAGLDLADLEPEPVSAGAAGTSLATRRVLTPAPRPTGPRVISPVRVPMREWGGTKAATPGYAESRWPTDVKIVVGALITAAVAAAIMVGLLLSNLLVAVIAALVLLLGLSGFLWMSRL